MTISRWDPLRDMITLHEAMNRLVNESFGRPGATERVALGPYVAVDIYETDTEVIISAVMPGVAEEDVQISVTSDALTISGKTRPNEEFLAARPLVRERRYGTSQRTIILPRGLDTDAIQARLEQGVLQVRLPKREEFRRRQVPVRFEPEG